MAGSVSFCVTTEVAAKENGLEGLCEEKGSYEMTDGKSSQRETERERTLFCLFWSQAVSNSLHSLIQKEKRERARE